MFRTWIRIWYYELLNFLVPEANYHVAENATIEKTLVEGSSKAKKDVNGKSKEKGKQKGKDNAKKQQQKTKK